MPRKPRIQYTETDKALMWDRWQKGDSLEKMRDRAYEASGSTTQGEAKTAKRSLYQRSQAVKQYVWPALTVCVKAVHNRRHS